MSKILVCLADRDEQESVSMALRLKRHHVSAAASAPAGDSPKKAAERMLESKAEVAILDYVADDAYSVKMLQAATDRSGMPRFIFILPAGAPTAHILMAVNEGAAAVLQRPVNPEALANYVERALSGPARLRHETGENCGPDPMELEKEAKALKAKLAAQRKLISYLMATPAADQRRSALVVSDSAYQRDNLRKLLEDHGFHVLTAANPEEGLATALAEKPRVVMSDLEMEGKNGVEFCRELKIVNKFTPCHFVICTASADKADTVMAPGNGVDACVLKPTNESGNLELVAGAAMGLLL